MSLHVFDIGPDTVIAHDPSDALDVWCEHYGEPRADHDVNEVEQLDDEAVITIMVDERGEISDTGAPVKRTAAEWAALENRGFLCSEEY